MFVSERDLEETMFRIAGSEKTLQIYGQHTNLL